MSAFILVMLAQSLQSMSQGSDIIRCNKSLSDTTSAFSRISSLRNNLMWCCRWSPSETACGHCSSPSEIWSFTLVLSLNHFWCLTRLTACRCETNILCFNDTRRRVVARTVVTYKREMNERKKERNKGGAGSRCFVLFQNNFLCIWVQGRWPPQRAEAFHTLWLLHRSVSQLFSAAAQSSSTWQRTLCYNCSNVIHSARVIWHLHGNTSQQFNHQYGVQTQQLHRELMRLACACRPLLKLYVMTDRHSWWNMSKSSLKCLDLIFFFLVPVQLSPQQATQ